MMICTVTGVHVVIYIEHSIVSDLYIVSLF